MVSNSVVDGGFDPWVKSKTTKLITFPLIMQHKRVRAKTSRISHDNVSWVERNVYPWTVVSLIYHYNKTKSSWACWSSTKQASSSHHWYATCSHDIAEELLTWHQTKITCTRIWNRHTVCSI